MNNVQLIGRLAADPQLRAVNGPNGSTSVVRFTVAVDRPPKQDGTREADFISCQAWGKRADIISQYFDKGNKIGLIGKIRTGSYVNQQGATVYTTDVEVSDIDFIDPKATQQPNAASPEYTYPQGQQFYQQPVQQQPVQQPVWQPAPKAKGKAKQQAVPVAQAQPQQVPAGVQAQGGWMNVPEGIPVDEGLPFN